jgi:hypothetical protein
MYRLTDETRNKTLEKNWPLANAMSSNRFVLASPDAAPLAYYFDKKLLASYKRSHPGAKVWRVIELNDGSLAVRFGERFGPEEHEAHLNSPNPTYLVETPSSNPSNNEFPFPSLSRWHEKWGKETSIWSGGIEV